MKHDILVRNHVFFCGSLLLINLLGLAFVSGFCLRPSPFIKLSGTYILDKKSFVSASE